MKKAALILLISIYSLCTLGIGIKQFYCCGKLKSTSISFVQYDNEKCSKGNEKKGCCQTKFQSLTIKDSHFAADAVITPVKSFTELHLLTPLFNPASFTNNPAIVANTSHPPPLHQSVPVYILHCVYRL